MNSIHFNNSKGVTMQNKRMKNQWDYVKRVFVLIMPFLLMGSSGLKAADFPLRAKYPTTNPISELLNWGTLI